MSFWKQRPFDATAETGLLAAGRSPLLARLLAIRGVTAADAEDYLFPHWTTPPDALRLTGVPQAVRTILPYVRDGRKIVVFGDYDCDGVCATAILTRGLRLLGANVSPFIPRRLGEGYGMSEASVKRMYRECPHAALVVTVDNGINSVCEVDMLHALGLQVVITDHHLRGETLPDAEALVNPKVAAPEEFANLCGSGVAYFLMQALVAAAKTEGLYAGPPVSEPLMVMAGLATVTDIMPLVGQNRILVAEALRRFQRAEVLQPGLPRRGAPPGLKELYQRAGRLAKACLNARDFSFTIGPRINSVGRLEDETHNAMDALALLLSDDVEEVRDLAQRIDECNVRRKGYEQRMNELAQEQIRPGAAVQVIDLDGATEGVHPGVAGIVAARLMDAQEPPVPVCVMVDGKGSARAPEGYNLRDALEACRDDLSYYGGHAAAAGLGIRPGMKESFTAAFAEEAQRQRDAMRAASEAAGSGPQPGDVAYDMDVTPELLTVDAVKELAKLEPLGEGNPEPRFAMFGVRPENVGTYGQEGRNLQFHVGGLRAVWWTHGAKKADFATAPYATVDFVFAPEISTYGAEHVELRIIELRPASDHA